jgi:hypothetical protein
VMIPALLCNQLHLLANFGELGEDLTERVRFYH